MGIETAGRSPRGADIGLRCAELCAPPEVFVRGLQVTCDIWLLIPAALCSRDTIPIGASKEMLFTEDTPASDSDAGGSSAKRHRNTCGVLPHLDPVPPVFFCLVQSCVRGPYHVLPIRFDGAVDSDNPAAHRPEQVVPRCQFGIVFHSKAKPVSQAACPGLIAIGEHHKEFLSTVTADRVVHF